MYNNQIIKRGFNSLSDYIIFKNNNKYLKEARLDYDSATNKFVATMINTTLY